MELISEGLAKIYVTPDAKISRKLEIFYNPVMKLNRDITILLLNSVPDKDMQVADPLAGTGVRAIRMQKELEPGKIKKLFANDMKADHLRKNFILNEITGDNIIIGESDANIFMLDSFGFDYIDIDPFGSPNPFLETSIVRLSRGGILGVTATDTAALSGTSKAACLRKYWAKPLKNELMHEIGIRILIRKVQLIGAEFEKALTPIFSYSKDHYFRVFFRCEKGRQKVDSLLESHKYLIYNNDTFELKLAGNIFNNEKNSEYAGPLWAGNLWDDELAGKMLEKCDKTSKELHSLLSIIKEESKIKSVGFYDLHKFANLYKKQIPKVEDVIKDGETARTHFLGWGVRSNKRIVL